jgi:hypothetical protein
MNLYANCTLQCINKNGFNNCDLQYLITVESSYRFCRIFDIVTFTPNFGREQQRGLHFSLLIIDWNFILNCELSEYDFWGDFELSNFEFDLKDPELPLKIV